MSEAAQTTDIYKFGDMYAANMDFWRQEYRVSWKGNWRDFPDLTSFPQISGATVASIPHSPQVNKLWAKSRVLCYGAASHIRLLDQGSVSGDEDEQFPVCKVAADDRQRRFIADEFEMLRHLGSSAAPVVRVHPEPLVDGKGIFGFRMEKLLAIFPDTTMTGATWSGAWSRYTKRASFTMIPSHECHDEWARAARGHRLWAVWTCWE